MLKIAIAKHYYLPVIVSSNLFCRCQYFVFEHSTDYQKVQFKFWEATETFDPNAIAVSTTTDSPLYYCVTKYSGESH